MPDFKDLNTWAANASRLTSTRLYRHLVRCKEQLRKATLVPIPLQATREAISNTLSWNTGTFWGWRVSEPNTPTSRD